MVDKTKEIHDKVFINVVNRVFLNNEVIKCLNEIINYGNELYVHSVNVAILSFEVGIRSAKNALELEEIFISGLLHDYGKLYIPEYILSKPDRLTIDEKKIIELHPSAGFLGLKRNTNLSDKITNAVLDHHERENTSGYDSRKNASNISEYARIIAPVDIYDAMVSDRIYRGSIDCKKVINYLSLCAGRDLKFEYVALLIDFLESDNVEDMLHKYTIMISELYDDCMKSNIGETVLCHII